MKSSFTRRSIINASAAAGAAGLFTRIAEAAQPGASLSPFESDNRKVVERFIKAWETTKNPDELANYLHQDCVIRLGNGMPPVLGRDAARALFAELLARGDNRELGVVETVSMGPVVMNARLTGLLTPTSKRREPSPVVGVFAFSGAVIQEWTDYRVPPIVTRI